MTKKVACACPGCGAALFALSVSSEEKGVAKLHSEPSPFATFVRLETVELLCANGCEVNVHRDSGEHTSSRLDSIRALPLVVEVLK